MKSRCVRKTPWAWLAALLLATGCEDAEGLSSPTCDDLPAANAEQAFELYAGAWDESDAFERRCRLERSLARDAWAAIDHELLQGQANVIEHLDEQIAEQHADGLWRHMDGPVAMRHAEARSAWTIETDDGTVLGSVEEWLEFDEDGRISRLHRLEGSGEQAPLGDALAAWQRAWNARDATLRTDALTSAVTEDVRFTNLAVDVRGRESLGAEITRQQAAIAGQLELDERVEVFVTVDGRPTVVRVRARMRTSQAGTVHITDYVRLRDGRIERLSGFPSAPR